MAKTRTTTAPTVKKASGLAALTQIASAKSAAGTKASIPNVRISKELEPHLTAMVDAKNRESLAKSEKENAQVEIKPWAMEQCIKLSREAGGVVGSVKLVGEKESATFSLSERCGTMRKAEGAEDQLMEIFGTDRFAKFFKVVPNIAIKNDITDDEIAKLVEALTDAKLTHLLEIDPVVKPKEVFYSASVLDTEIAALTEKANNLNLCKVVTSFRK